MHFGTHALVYTDNMHLKRTQTLGGARSLLHDLFCITLPQKLEHKFAAVPKRETVTLIFIYLFEDLVVAGYVNHEI